MQYLFKFLCNAPHYPNCKSKNSGEDQGVIQGDNERSVLAYLHLHVVLRSSWPVRPVAAEVIIYPGGQRLEPHL